MKELRPASELRKEHDAGETKAFEEVWNASVDLINQKHDNNETECSLSSIDMTNTTKQGLKLALEDKEYIVDSGSDPYGDHWFVVRW